MDLFEINQEIDAVELYRKGTTQILNPKELKVTILDDVHYGDETGYSKDIDCCYELAEILTYGLQYRVNPPIERPFMFYLKEFIDNNNRHKISPIIKKNMTYDKNKKGWWVDWNAIADRLKPLCEQYLAQDVSPMLPPITKESQKKKTRVGYGNTTLYATGQLFQAVYVY